MKITVSVSNDLVTDHRVHKVCTTLFQNGYDIKLVGRKFKKSILLNRVYRTHRMRLFFNKSFLFYAEYNLRLFFYLLLDKTDAFLSNDTDTLLANYLVSKIRRKPLIFDAHEMFPEVPEVINRKHVKYVWTKIEDWIFPKLKSSYTVCRSIADIYNEKYGISMQVIRNIPFAKREAGKEKMKLPLHENKKILIYQGAVNVGRGIEWVIDAMPFLDDFIFYVIGDGDVLDELQEKVKNQQLEDRVIFTGRVPFEELPFYTACADIGINLLENKGLNYYYSLPNRIFDYIRAGIPVLAIDFPEIRRIVAYYNVGLLVNDMEPHTLSQAIKQLGNSSKDEEGFKKAGEDLTWEKESVTLLKLVKKTLSQTQK